MDTKTVHDHGQNLQTYGYLIGVFDLRQSINRVSAQIDKSHLTTDKVRILEGDEGIHLLQRSDTFFFADGEHKAILDLTNELKQGNFVVAFSVDDEQEAEWITNLGRAEGGRNFTYFGRLVVTRLSK